MNARVMAIAPSMTLGISSRAKELASQGKRVCSFAAGEPDFDTPAHIKAAAAQALEAGETKYTPEAGLLSLRRAIAEKLLADNGLSYSPEQIVVSNGAKHSVFNAVMTLCGEGDEVVIPAPYWLSYPEMVRMVGATPIAVPCREQNDYKMTPAEFEAAITPRTKAVILNSPSNPIGVVYTEAELRRLTDVAVARGLYIVSDEIYEKMVYDGATHASPAGFSPEALRRTITINGFSKAYAMTGWRLGYLAAPVEIAKAISALQSHSTSGPNTFAQYGATAALKGPQACVGGMVAAFAERRAYLYERLAAMRGLRCVKPTGAFYMLPNISAFGLEPVAFCRRLLDEAYVAAVPGTPFGAPQNIRLSYACSMDCIKEGMDRLERFIASL